MTNVLQVTDLHKSFGGVVAADNINISVDEQEIIGIIGANGAGKTTFVNMVTGYMPPTSGAIVFKGQSIIGLQPRDITKLGLTRTFQIPQVFLSESVFDNLTLAYGIAEQSGIDRSGQKQSEYREHADATEPQKEKTPESRSGGTRAAVPLPPGDWILTNDPWRSNTT